MEDANKPVAKSLHTVKVIQQVAAHVMATAAYSTAERRNNPTRAAAVAEAMEVLGLSGRPDPYELAEKALRLWK
jgi:hypothetical protein